MKDSRKGIIFLFIGAIILFILTATGALNAYAAFALAAVVAAYFLLNRQIWILLVATPLALIPGQFIHFEVQPNWIYDLSLAEIFLAGGLLMFGLHFLINYPKVPVRFGKIGWWLLAYGILAALSFFYINDTQLYVAGLKVLVFSLAAYFLAINLLDSAFKLKTFFYSLALTAIILSIQIFVMFYGLGFSNDLFFNRSEIMIAYGPIALVSATLAFILPLLLGFYFYLDINEKGRIIFLLAFILGAAAVFIILGKAAILSLSIALVYFIRKLKGKRLGLLLFFFCFALITYAIFSQYASGLVSRIGSTFIDKNTEARLEEYRVAFRIVQERPLLGVGSGQQLAYYQRYINPDYRKLINNYVTQAAVDYGLVGLAIFAVLLWSIFGQSRHLTKRLSGDSKVIGRALNASLIVAAINGLFEVTVFTLFYAIFLWLLIGLASIIKYGKIDGYHN